MLYAVGMPGRAYRPKLSDATLLCVCTRRLKSWVPLNDMLAVVAHIGSCTLRKGMVRWRLQVSAGVIQGAADVGGEGVDRHLRRVILIGFNMY